MQRGWARAAIDTADRLLERREPAVARRLQPRERRTEATLAALLAVVAVLLLVLNDEPWPGALTVLGLVATYAVLAEIRLQIGTGLIGPTQLAFVPMLFLLPPLAVPALVASGKLLGELRAILQRRAHWERGLIALTDSWYSVGPALVVAAFSPSQAWYVYVLVLAAQFAADFLASAAREWFGAGIPPRRIAPMMWLIYVADALLTPVGVLVVLASDGHPAAFLLALGPAALLAAIGHERATRIERELELGRAYRDSHRRIAEAIAVQQDRAGLERVLLAATAGALQADDVRLGEDGPGRADAVSVPLPGDARQLVAVRAGRPFDDGERELLGQLATQVSASLENLGLHEVVRAREAEQRAVLEGVSEAIFAENAAGEIVYANPSAVALDPARLELTDEDGRPVRLPGPRALRGEPVQPLVVRHGTRWARVKAGAVPDERGEPRLAITVIEDITDLKRAERAQRFLADSARALVGSLELEQTLPAVARLAVPEIADGCELHVLGERELRLVAAEPAPDPALQARVREVVRTGLPWLREDALVVPMRAPARTVGAIVLTCAGDRRFGAGEIELAEQLGLHAGSVVDTARLYRTRSAIAQTLQASLLPPVLPEIEALETAALYRAAGEGYEVGGDFYDVFSTGASQWFAVIGDVCGKGAEAAAVTALARYTLRAAVVQHRSPADMLRWLNDAMLRQRSAGATRFATIACVRFDLDDHGTTATVACGGHPTPRVLRRSGAVEEVGRPGTLLGALPEVRLEDHTTRLSSGDALVLYTDGLTEAGAPRRVWTPEELDEAVAAAREGTAQEIVEQLAFAALGGEPPHDDMALLAVRVRAGR
jgi:serine phosphatase RsbU (regulator of sigma subunit)/PAS domain-containing protein